MNTKLLGAMLGIVAILGAPASPALAAWETPATVTSKAISPESQKTNLVFLTASEVRKYYRGVPVDFLENYAVVKIGKNDIRVIRLDEKMICSSTFTKSCASIHSSSTGADQHGYWWKICFGYLC